MYGKKAKALLDLLNKQGLTKSEGSISFSLLNTKVAVSDKNSIGSLIQEWLGQWMKDQKIFHRVNQNTQEFPDFYLGKSDEEDLLEVKAFDYDENPNFDLANFDAYVRSLKTKAYKLNADYLIFGYSLEKGKLKIKEVWLKKIWEITCPSNQYALRCQVKQGKIVNIRPYNFKSASKGFQPFGSRIKFVEAIRNTIKKVLSEKEAKTWLSEVEKSYLQSSGGGL